MTQHLYRMTGLLTAILIHSTLTSGAESPTAVVDFCFSPPEWQTAICLPDDPQKSLVDRSGELLYRYNEGGREFATRIAVEVSGSTRWQKQQLHSPLVPIVQTHRTADGLEILEEAFAVTPQALDSLCVTDASMGTLGSQARNDLILVRVSNPGTETRTLHSRLIVDTTLPFTFQSEAQRVVTDGHETVTTSLKMVGAPETTGTRRGIQLEELTVPAGQTEIFFVLYSGGSPMVIEPTTVKQAMSCRDRAVEYWKRAPLPVGRVQVPDAGIQSLVDSSIRNIWQAREIKNGLPVFQVGPTCYRGLWVVDGAFLLEAASMIGAGKDARGAITHTLAQQKSSGAFEVLHPRFFKENGIVLWTCVRHAMLTQDKPWLESVWPQLERTAGYIKELQKQSLENDTPLDDGINPPGEIDGGLSGQAAGFKQPEFSNVHWNLLGLRALIEAAHWLGKPDGAARWQGEYDNLNAAFRKAATRDLRQDGQGHSYVPIFMNNEGDELPQRAQWTFCHAVYPGQIFVQNDPLVAGTLKMLEATEREGMVYGTGWNPTGIWNYFASFYGHAWLWQGNGRKAVQVLYAFANHAAPTLVWREEQSLVGETFQKVGDMPHNWASAEFIRLVVHILALDRGSELHLLEGFPKEWAGPGMITRLNGICTPFGRLDMTVQADQEGKSVTVSVKPLAANCSAIVVHFPDGATHRIVPQQGGAENHVIEHTLQPLDRTIPMPYAGVRHRATTTATPSEE